MAAVKTGFDARERTFRVPSEMGWAQQIRARVARRGEREFVEQMGRVYGWDVAKARRWYSYRVQYGFSTEVIVLMARVYDGIRQRYPDLSDEQVDYLWLRIMGGAQYGEDGLGQIRWDVVAGPMGHVPTPGEIGDDALFGDKIFSDEDVKSIYQGFGLTEKEANTLHYELRLQHVMAGERDRIDSQSIHENDSNIKQGDFEQYKASAEAVYGPMSDEEFDQFWDSRVEGYQPGIDFTHQAITSATELYRSDWQSVLPGTVNTLTDVLAFFVGTDMKGLAGWVGDVTIKADVKPSMSDADYRADLDAVNISQRMESTGKTYQQVQEEYYAEIDAGKTNRAEEFVDNVGEEEVRRQVYSLLPPIWSPMHRHLNTDEDKRNYLAGKYPDSYNFLRSIEERSNSLKIYAELKEDEE